MQGDWSDSSPLWTPALRGELGNKQADDGAFWMKFDDFLEIFDSVTVEFISLRVRFVHLRNRVILI